jgi:outer membrane protein assembly factor BamB
MPKRQFVSRSGGPRLILDAALKAVYWKSIGLALALAAPPAPCQTRVLTNLWQVDIGRRSDSTPALGDDGTVYFGARDGRLWALGSNGAVRWVFRADREIKSSPALARDGTVYVGSRDHYLYALGPRGKLRWRFQTGAWVDSSPALARDGTVYFGSWDKNFYALNPDGSQRWRFNNPGELVSSPAVGLDGVIYFGSHDCKLYALSPDGQKKWTFATGGPIISSPALNLDQCLYFTSVDGFLYAVNLDGSLRWRLHTGGVTESSPVIGQDGTVYVGVSGNVWAVTPEGKPRWQRVLEDPPGSGPLEAAPVALTHRAVAVFPRTGLLITLADEGQWLSTYYCYGSGYASPAVGPSGIMYIADRGRFFTAVDGNLPAARSPWPMFHANPRHTGNQADVEP